MSYIWILILLHDIDNHDINVAKVCAGMFYSEEKHWQLCSSSICTHPESERKASIYADDDYLLLPMQGFISKRIKDT